MFRNLVRRVATRSEISSKRHEYKSEIAAIKADVAEIKTDVAALRVDLSDFRYDTSRQFAEVHKQASNNVRTILAGVFGVGSATVAVNQYINAKREEVSLSPTVKKP